MSASESYVQQLQNFQNNYPSIDYTLEIPEEEPIYSIDKVTRKINGPKNLGVVEDHQSDRVIFEIDRECNGVDLAQTICIIVFKNANNKTYTYVVPKYNITKDQNGKKIYFIWTLQMPVMEKAGIVQYMIKFFNIDANNQIRFELNTQVTQAAVLNTWDHTISGNAEDLNYYNVLIDPQIQNLFNLMQEAIDNQYFDVYWTDL